MPHEHVSDKRKLNKGRPPKYDRQVELLVKDVHAINKKLDNGLQQVADEYEEIVRVAIEVGLGRGSETYLTPAGERRERPRTPNVPMLKHLLDVGIAMVDKTGEGPDSPSQRILRAMRERMGVVNNTQVNIDNFIASPPSPRIPSIVEGDA